MTYAHFDHTKPDPATQNIVDACASMRANERAVALGVVTGSMPLWNAVLTGDPWAPSVITHSNGAERVRETLTYGTTGGAAGVVVQDEVDYSADSGATWMSVSTLSITYDANGYVTALTWS